VSSRRSVLLLCDDHRGHAGTILEHIRAFQRYSRHQVLTFNPRGLSGSRLLDLDEFDAVVIHYSLVVTSDHYLAPAFREKIRAFNGLKIQFLQDEYRWVDEITAMLRHLGIAVLYSVVPAEHLELMYAGRLPGVETRPTLTGYVPEELLDAATPPAATRPIDIGYRGRELPYWLGRLGQEKVAIGREVLRRARPHHLRCDIAWRESDRIYGPAWKRFLGSCRSTLGSGSGASITDFDGSIERTVRDYLARRPKASYAEVDAAVLGPHEGNLIMNIISPRVFEAAALRTAMIMFPGPYSGVVEADRHYIPLAPDFSNFPEVVRRLRDHRYLDELTARAHADLIRSGEYSIRRLIEDFDSVVDGRCSSRVHSLRLRYRAARAGIPIRRSDRASIGVGRVARALARATGSSGLRRFAVDPASYSAKGYAALRRVTTDPALRGVMLAYLRDRGARQAISGDLVLEDLLELEVLRRAGSSRRPPFLVASHLEDQQLVFESRPPASLTEAVDWEEIAAGLRQGRIRGLRWDHRPIGLVARLDFGRSSLTVAVGDHGVHQFRALQTIAATNPEPVLRALRAAVAGPDRGAASSSEAHPAAATPSAKIGRS